MFYLKSKNSWLFALADTEDFNKENEICHEIKFHNLSKKQEKNINLILAKIPDHFMVVKYNYLFFNEIPDNHFAHLPSEIKDKEKYNINFINENLKINLKILKYLLEIKKIMNEKVFERLISNIKYQKKFIDDFENYELNFEPSQKFYLAYLEKGEDSGFITEDPNGKFRGRHSLYVNAAFTNIMHKAFMFPEIGMIEEISTYYDLTESEINISVSAIEVDFQCTKTHNFGKQIESFLPMQSSIDNNNLKNNNQNNKENKLNKI